MGRSLAQVCEFVGCLPSELYEKYNPTIGDFLFIAKYNEIKAEEEAEKLKALMGV